MKKEFKILFISDTHTKHLELFDNFEIPSADFIVHCGDISNNGEEKNIRKFLKWFASLELYEHKIFIAGNHDRLFENERGWAHKLVAEYSVKYGRIHYLEDSGVELNGLKFWGSPVSKPIGNWAFNRPEYKMKSHWEAIPEDTDILITHSPPYGIMDFATSGSYVHSGSESLYFEIFNRIRPKISAFGHIHEQYGSKIIDNIKFINASNLDAAYDVVNPPVLAKVKI